jgi:integrase
VEAVERWILESTKVTLDQDKGLIKWLHPYLGDKMLSEIDRALIDRIKTVRMRAGKSASTVNRTLQVIRAILRRAQHEWEWIDRCPNFRLLPEPPRRVPMVTREQLERLFAHLPEHLSVMARFSLETGLRKSNVTGLRWGQVDLVRRHVVIHADQAKARKAIGVPLSRAAVELVRRQLGKHLEHVFTYKGRPVEQVNTKAWTKALGMAGIENFRWHDLRHLWARSCAEAGVPQAFLQELGGWSSPSMVARYAHLGGEHLMAYVDRAAELRAGVVTEPSNNVATLASVKLA